MANRTVTPGAQHTAASAQLTVLDLIKHSAMIIIKNMDQQDCLGITVFYAESEALHPPSPMNPRKAVAEHIIRGMKTKVETNVLINTVTGPIGIG